MSFFHLSDLALTLFALAMAGTLGLMLGHLKVKGVGLGIGGVLFSGIFVGHLASSYGIVFDEQVLDFVREFGLILFVYTIGIQVGPTFFSAFRKAGVPLNLAAVAIVLLGVAMTLLVYRLTDLPLPVLVGLMSGAVTNTPGLGAATQALSDVGLSPADVADAGLGYAVAYPFGILGILAAMLLIRLIFRIDIKAEADRFTADSGGGASSLPSSDIVVTNPNLDGLRLEEVPDLFDAGVVASRIKKGSEVFVPTHDTIVHLGDTLHIVGKAPKLRAMQLILGHEAEAPVTTKGSRLTWARLVVTERKALGHRLKSLAFEERYRVTVSRINRAGIELPPTATSTLAFGDIVTVVGTPEDIDAVKGQLGNQRARLDEVQFAAVLIGIALGILIGSIPIALPGLPAPLKLGLAGGPLVAAILLGRLGTYGPFNWFMPPVANTALRELGIVLFLAVVGIHAGDSFLDALIHGPGLSWMGWGAMITFIPLITVGLIARAAAKMNYLSLSGVLAGSMTDPPALAFAVGLSPVGAASVAYVAVYPLVMVLRILAPQVIVLVLAATGAGG